MLPKGMVQRGFDHVAIARMTCNQIRREPHGPVGSESTYWLRPGKDRDVAAFALTEIRSRNGRGDMMRRMVRWRICRTTGSGHKFSRLMHRTRAVELQAGNLSAWL